ncbi:MAG: FAD-dependent oxidoreductase [Phycisphaerae bacterium]|nr:FAD-dependent oxidoreductase [Phycisphaerae bacterium]
MNQRRVLILGGGFAGLAAAGRAARRGGEKVAVHLVDRRAESVCAPLLPDLISGRVAARHMRYDLAAHCRRRGVTFTRAEVYSIDTARRRVATSAGEMTGDAIVICLGCETNYFGRDELVGRTVGLKSVEQGETIAHAAAERIDRGSADLLVVGGGYTGFEAAGHLALLARRRTGQPPDRLAPRVRIRILEKGDAPLGNLPPPVRRWAWRGLSRRGVEIVCGCTVAQVGDDGSAELTTGERVRDPLIVWTPGVAPGAAVAGLPADTDARGRLAVNHFLRLRDAEGVFAAGDVAAARPGGSAPLRMAVQFSLSGGRAAADNALRWLAGRAPGPFAPPDLGYLVPLGAGGAAGVVLGRTLMGRLPLGLHYVMCALRSWGAPNRIGVVSDLLKGP